MRSARVPDGYCTMQLAAEARGHGRKVVRCCCRDRYTHVHVAVVARWHEVFPNRNPGCCHHHSVTPWLDGIDMALIQKPINHVRRMIPTGPAPPGSSWVASCTASLCVASSLLLRTVGPHTSYCYYCMRERPSSPARATTSDLGSSERLQTYIRVGLRNWIATASHCSTPSIAPPTPCPAHCMQKNLLDLLYH